MLFCAYFGVPTVMVSGDRACCEEAQALVADIEVASVKEGAKRGPASGLTGAANKLHNGAAVHLHPERARQLIREKAEAGLERVEEIGQFWLEPPYELVSVLRPTEAEPAKTAVCRGDDLIEVLSMPRRHE
jgi:D-amino peptidase